MFAPAFENLFSIIHELVSKHQQKDTVIKLTNKWVNIEPTAWKTKRDVKVSVGVGAGNKESMLQALSMQAQEQMGLMPLGIVKPENVYQTMIEKSKLQGFSNPMKFWSDPSQQPPQPPPPDPAIIKIQSEEKQSQMDMQLEGAKLKQQQEESEKQMMLEKYKADLAAQTQKEIEAMRIAAQKELEEYKMHCEAEMKGADMQHEAMLKNFDAEKTDKLEEKKIRLSKDPAPDATAIATNAVDQFQVISDQFLQAMNEMRKSFSAPKRVKRGPDGRVEGIEMVPESDMIGGMQ